ncbi:hypothetical protein [Bdellovibrio bacteriovorus]|uniref:hypothetical protein n=1 Tax=Bdellovibrio bacteriovorus TaxID=959 RepID=UPI00045BEF76|nr:hypothetical protein [Bdellovibrio bacteriovorus]AHZ84834.1 hypothetical protein EP01_07780 [Bdellovibrio bacteriovorus]BEV68720.1 hypothetical protein Bb109J_c2140 [Bdellovibrio bacteriovorus]
MEGLNNKTLSFPAKMFTRAFAALGMVLALAACGKGGGGGTNTNVGLNCLSQACGNITAPVVLTTFQSQSSTSNPEIILQNMQIIVSANLIQQNASGNNYNNYQGPIAIQGQMVVTKQMLDVDTITGAQLTPCVLPAGTYNLQTLTTGTMGLAGGDVNVPAMLSNVGNIEVKIENGQLFTSGTRLFAKVSVTRVNGYACSGRFFGSFY